jgi:hypothetical protein
MAENGNRIESYHLLQGDYFMNQLNSILLEGKIISVEQSKTGYFFNMESTRIYRDAEEIKKSILNIGVEYSGENAAKLQIDSIVRVIGKFVQDDIDDTIYILADHVEVQPDSKHV